MQDGLFRASLAVALAAILSAGCSGDDSALDGMSSGVPITALSISPSAFLGDVPCSSKPGALQSYVVTLVCNPIRDLSGNVTVPCNAANPELSITLPSSEPVTCSQRAFFRYILASHVYMAEIDAYDVPAGALVPSGTPPSEGQASDPSAPQGLPGSGSRHMLLRATKTPIAPRWTTTCEETLAESQKTNPIQVCDALKDLGSAAPTSILVDPRVALGDLACAEAGGEVATIDITPAGGALPPQLGVACGAKPVVFEAGVTPGQVYSFRLEARAEPGGEVRWGSSCFAAAEEGLQTSAACDPLSSKGSVEIAPAALTEAGLACGGDVKAFEATLQPLGISSGPVPCGESARFLAIEPGTYDVILREVGPDGPVGAGVTCGAVVAPGATAGVTCMKAP
jgi:hypothetical protein